MARLLRGLREGRIEKAVDIPTGWDQEIKVQMHKMAAHAEYLVSLLGEQDDDIVDESCQTNLQHQSPRLRGENAKS